MTMTSRERFAAMLNHKTPDRMPVYPLVNSISRQSLGITYEEWTKDINKCAEAIIRTTDELELDCLCTLVDLSVEAAAFGQELLYFKDKAACPDPAQRVVRGDARHGLLRAVQIIQPLGRHIRAQKTLGRLLGELFEIKPQAEARKALVRLDRSR